MLDFKPLTLDDRPTVMQALRRRPPSISEHSFTNLYVWRYHRPVRVARVGDGVAFVELRSGERRLVGPPRADVALTDLLEELRESAVASFHRMPEDAAEALRQAGLRVEADRDNADYVYLRSDLAELSGRDYGRQRNLVNQCLGSYDCEYAELTPGCLEEAVEMVNRWFAARGMDQSEGLAEEYWALREALDLFEELDLIGGTVRIGGRIEALTLGERLSDDTAVVHFEKAVTDYRGLYQVINQWFCRNGLAEFDFVNREQDLGIPGLRKAKESYRPHHMVDKYVARSEPTP
jgi:hypothetical protein